MTTTSAPARTGRLLRIPGGRLAAETPGAAARLAAGAGWLLGPRAWRICQAGRSNNQGGVHRLERRWGAAVSAFLDIRWDVAGLEHAVPDRRFIVLPLHEGFADALGVLQLNLDVRFVARNELFEWPALGRYLRDTAQVLIDPGEARTAYRHLLRSGQDVLDRGEALVMFPQGSILGIEVAFWQGAFRLAQQLDAWVLPVVMTGSHRVWEHPYSPLVRFGQPMSMRVLPPVPPGEAVGAARTIEAEMKRMALDSVAPPRRFRPEVDGYWDDYPYEIDPAFPELAIRVATHRESLSQ